MTLLCLHQNYETCEVQRCLNLVVFIFFCLPNWKQMLAVKDLSLKWRSNQISRDLGKAPKAELDYEKGHIYHMDECCALVSVDMFQRAK